MRDYGGLLRKEENFKEENTDSDEQVLHKLF
jgi:hypothetical protein